MQTAADPHAPDLDTLHAEAVAETYRDQCRPRAPVKERLARLHNRRTCYELALISPDGQRFLACYTDRRTRRMLYHAATERWGISARARVTVADWKWCDRALDGIYTDSGWRLAWTGRTEREAINNGELPYVGHK